VWAGVLGFAFATFGIAWAWGNFSWFASAYDTDDWIFRLATLVQMLGVLIFALGLPAMFASLVVGDTVNNAVMVAGYVVMRAGLLFLWLRAARPDPAHRPACLAYAKTLVLAQAGWGVPTILDRDLLLRGCVHARAAAEVQSAVQG
jgi:low temperature requirement protein LtrA